LRRVRGDRARPRHGAESDWGGREARTVAAWRYAHQSDQTQASLRRAAFLHQGVELLPGVPGEEVHHEGQVDRTRPTAQGPAHREDYPDSLRHQRHQEHLSGLRA
ncbi:unnamed protein product, partial [Ectocarpus fasciculatus]